MKKDFSELVYFLFLLLSVLEITACKKLERFMAVSTGEVANILTNSAEISGEVIDIGEGAIQHGHCYAKTPNVSITALKTELGSLTDVGGFTSHLSNLEPATKYYTKAYISNGNDIQYGNEINFTTESISVPALTTDSVTLIKTTSATSGGNINSDGGVPITARGVCWRATPGPTIADNKTTEGTGTGSFISMLIGLTPETKYYVKAYATNSVGTAYGNEISFTTTIISLPSLSTLEITDTTATSAASGGNITSDGGASVTARGVCWSTTANPTTLDLHTNDGMGDGSFISNISGLAAGTTYHVRAYATNSVGTAYGLNVTFTTKTISVPSVTTTSIYSIASTSASTGGNVTTDNGQTVTARGVCYGTNQNPTITDSKTSNGTGKGTFSSYLTGLNPNTTYYVRAYATSSVGTGYGNQESFKTNELLIDVDGNVYNIILIGTQVWTQENLMTTKYNDNTPIPYVTDTWANLTTPAFCYYGNDSSNKTTYGALYNWHAVNTGLLCPTDWHVPTQAEWTALVTFLGGEDGAGGKLKESETIHWEWPNTGATNETGFTALPGGKRRSDGTFSTLGTYGHWWSSTESDAGSSWVIYTVYASTEVIIGPIGKSEGFSIRCIKD